MKNSEFNHLIKIFSDVVQKLNLISNAIDKQFERLMGVTEQWTEG
jgi:regulator of RNase E activity RraB